MKLRKIKRPGGVHVFEVCLVSEDEFGTWLYSPVGSRWEAPHAVGTLKFDVVLLLNPGRRWVAWWVDDPTGRHVIVDICLPPVRETDGWSFVDLELDPVRHESGAVEILDRDEFDSACRDGWITPADAVLADSTAMAVADALRRRDAPLSDEGWRRLEAATRR